MTETANIPELRFSEFRDEWAKVKLDNVGNIFTGKTPDTSNSELYEGKYPFVSPIDIHNNRYVKDTNKTVSKKGFYGGRVIRKGASLFVCIGSTIGKVGQAEIDVTTNQQINALIPYENYDDNFIYSTLFKSSNKIKKLAATQAVPIINKKTFSIFSIYIPKFKEQQKIGDFFSKLDQQIELEEKKLAKLEEQKKGYIQKIFSQKLRFKDKNRDEYPEWESKKLKDIANVYQPQNLSQNNFQKKGYPVYGANGVIGYYKDFNHSNMEIAVACRGNTCGRVNLTEPKSWITSNAMVVNIIDKMEIEFYFLYQYLRIINYNNVISGSGQPQITRKNMNSVELLVPNYIEQQKIGNLFRRFDDFIEKQSQKIDLLKERKKGFLQKMFV